MQALVDGKEISFPLNEQLTYGDLDLRRPEDFWTLLLSTGYLTLARPARAGMECRARIPNEEVRQVFEKRIQSRFSKENGGFSQAGRDFALAACRGDAEAMRGILGRVLEGYVSVRDSATRARAENFYHGFLSALLSSAGGAVKGFASNQEAGDGSADILFTSLDQNAGVVLELKHSRKDSDMESDAGRALRQIEDKRYVRGLLGRGCKRFYGYGYGYGIAFSRKSCVITGGAIEA